MSMDNFTVIADERNNTPELVDKEHMCVSIDLHKYMYSLELIIDEKTGRVIKINNTDVEDRIYNPNFIKEAIEKYNGTYKRSIRSKDTPKEFVDDLESFAKGEKE